MAQRNLSIVLTGTRPLLLNAPTTVDPLAPLTKQIKVLTGKRSKTEDDHAEIARLEYIAGIYHDPDFGPYVPGFMVEAAIRAGAKLTKKGAAVQRALFVSSDVNPIIYKGPRDLDGLWADPNFRNSSPVKVGMSRTMRTRPQFLSWEVTADAVLDDAVLDLDVLRSVTSTAGELTGIGDWRPRYGRFTAVIKEKK